METNVSRRVSPTPRRERLIQVLVVAAALCGLLLFLYHVALPMAFIANLKWSSDSNISNAEEQGVNWILAHGYRDATSVRADGYVSVWPAGDNVSVVVLVTLESADSFDSIRNWYSQHPEVGFGGSLESGNIFPREGLDKLQGTSSGKTRYRVTYLNTTTCVVDCDRPLHQIR